MAIVINGSGTVTGLAVGGLPDGTVDDGTVASGIASSKLTGALPAIDGASLTGITTGKVLQVKSVNFQGAYTAAVDSWTDVNNFTVAITPAATSSKVLVQAMIQVGSEDWMGLNIVRTVGGSSTVLNLGNDTLGNKKNSSFGSMQITQWGSELTVPQNFVFLDSPSTTAEITYKVQIVSRWGSTSNPAYINRPHSWNDDSISGRVTASNMIVTEVKA